MTSPASAYRESKVSSDKRLLRTVLTERALSAAFLNQSTNIEKSRIMLGGLPQKLLGKD